MLPLPIGGTSEMLDDPEILALLDFEPVPRRPSQANCWTPELQRELILLIAEHGSSGKACNELGKDRGGAAKVYNSPDGESFRAAWDGAVALYRRRAEERIARAPRPKGRPPTVDLRFKAPSPPPSPSRGEGEMLNEFGEWEDEASHARRAEEARDSIAGKLRRARRLFLHDISGCPAKRAAFEILTELAVDWDKAERCLPQDDEPWRRPQPREPDLLLAAEAGWIGGDLVHGPDKKAELLSDINAWRARQGLPPVHWQGESIGEEVEAEWPGPLQ